MNGLMNLANQAAMAIAIILPVFFYWSSWGCFFFSVWGFYMQSTPQNPFRGKPWIPWVSLIMSGVFASFLTFINLTDISVGSSVILEKAASLTSYTQTINSSSSDILGDNAGDAAINVVKMFRLFFQTVGLFFAYCAVVAFRNVNRGSINRRYSSCAIQFITGIMLINCVPITQWLVLLFNF